MKNHLTALLLLAALTGVTADAQAQANLVLRCVPVQEMAGKPMKTLISEHIKETLTGRNWQNISVTIGKIQLGKSTDGNQPLSAPALLTRGVAISIDNDGTRSAALQGQLGAHKEASLNCSIPLTKTKIYVSGQYRTEDGQTVRVTRAPVDVSDLFVPGLLVPALTKAP